MCSFISHILLCISIHFLEIFIRHLTYIHAIVMLGECARACMWICLHVQSPALYVHSFPRTSACLRECNLFTVTVNILHLVAQWPCANVFVLYATLNKVYLILSYLQDSPLAGEPRERLFHIHIVHRYQLCKKYLYPSTLSPWVYMSVSQGAFSCISASKWQRHRQIVAGFGRHGGGRL